MLSVKFLLLMYLRCRCARNTSYIVMPMGGALELARHVLMKPQLKKKQKFEIR
jgi:hypothetical protein